MSSILALPGRYVQGSGVIHEIGKHVLPLGDRALLIGGPTALSVSQEAIAKSLEHEDVELAVRRFNGECTEKEIARLTGIAEKEKVNIVIGAGGGKALDTAKAVAHYRRIPVACVPTIASTDAPCSGGVGLYNEEHESVGGIYLHSNPNVVVVDSEIILNSPIRYTVAGMGDALATMFEAEACIKSSAPNIHGGSATATGFACAKLCYELLMEHGLEAKRCIKEGLATDALDKLLEATVLLSGVGFENCGLSVAHGLWVGFSRLEEFRKLDVYHGEAVALFTLVQLVLEGRPREFINDVVEFCNSVGLPVSLADIGLDGVSRETLLEGIKAAAAPPEVYIYNVPFSVDLDMICDAMLEADSIGRASKET